MNKFTLIIAFIAISVLCVILPGHAQNTVRSKVFLQKEMRSVSYQSPSLHADNFFKRQATSMGLSNPDEMQLIKTIAGKNGYEHFRYQQVYQSIPVFGSAYTIHQKNGIVTYASGYYLPLIDVEVRPEINPQTAIQIARQEMDVKADNSEEDQNSTILSFLNEPKAILTIMDRSFPKSSEQYALAYQIEIASSEPLDKRRYFIDAHTGAVLLDLPLLMHHAVPAQGVTKYYGTQAITVDSLAPNNFLLRDPSRNGNSTLTGALEIWSNTSNSWDLTNEAQDEVALDAHYCTQEFYDFMLENLDWDGLDNEGLPMNIVVHAGDFVNAFWNGEYAAFGDGDCNHGPLTTLEVVAHEFMHGITNYTSDLIYRDESGAINESMSDIFGKALEFYTTPDEFDWLLGASFIETPYAESFRSFEDPNSREHPKFYQGEFWQDGGGVHTNSSVGNHWFYQMVNGGSGVNEAGEPYNIVALGMDKAIQIVFLTQKAYLTSNSTYNFYYESSLLAAEELYGANAPEIQSVAEAWKVVGLPNNNDPGVDTGIDLGIAFMEQFVEVCLNNEFYSSEVIVTNYGTINYTPDLSGIITIYGGVPGSFQELELNEEIAPGESRIYPVEEILFFDMENSEAITADLQLENDENADNNFTIQFVDNSIYVDNDLSLRTPQLPEITCLTDSFRIEFNVSNSSCNPLPAGTNFEIRVTSPNSGFFWSINRSLETELLRDRSYRIFETIGLEPGEDYEAELVYAEDVNLDNNIRSLPNELGEPIIGVYDNTMNSEDPKILIDGFFPYDFLNLNGDNALAVSSYIRDSRNLCLDASESIEGQKFGQSGTFVVCADLVDMDYPVLGFDLAQYRNSEGVNFPELEDNTTILKASWISETDRYSQVVVGQAEGVMIHYDIPLPARFKGKIQFDFFHNTGRFGASNYLNYDVSFLDNLTINEILVSNDDLENAPVTIYPNPSTGWLSIIHPEIPTNLVLRNTQGQVLRNIDQSGNLNELDLSALPDSYYFLTISYGEAGQVTRGVVKMSK